MRTDDDIKRDVEEELRWDPEIDSSNIAVAVKDGVLTLTGFVPSFVQKFRADEDAKRIARVVAVANEIDVRLQVLDQRPDPDIARDAVQALKDQLPYSHQNIKVIVRDGWVTLEGDVEWNYQRERAEDAVRGIRGIKSVLNAIQVKPKTTPVDIRKQIDEALRRRWEEDARNIQVETHDGEAILKGAVRSWVEREEAERAAWSAPGIRKVVNQIVIQP